jgi:hypothetical protein
MNLAKTKKYFPIMLIGALAICVVIGIMIYTIVGTSKQKQNQQGISSDPNDSYNKSYDEIQAKEQANPDPLQKAADLRSKLPYKGTNFSLDFDYDKQTFVLTLKKSNQAAGNSEFEQFIQANGVDKKSMKITTKVQ